MKTSTTKTELIKEEIDTKDNQNQPLDLNPRKPNLKRTKQRPKRGGCIGSLAGNAIVGLAGNAAENLAEDKATELIVMKQVLHGNGATALMGYASTSLDGESVVSLAADTSVTSLLILSKEAIQKGTIIKKADLVGCVVISTPVNEPGLSTNVEDLIGKVAVDNIPANKVLASVGLTGNQLVNISEIKHPPHLTLVIRTKKAIRKRDVIKEDDLEWYLILKPVSSLDMFTGLGDLVGKVATEKIPEHRILKKYMVNYE